MQLAKRLDRLPPYLFVDINRRIADLRSKGIDIVTFAIGDPDMPTPGHIIERICDEARVPANHRYPETDGLPELHDAIADWYQARFDVDLDPETEVLPLIGSKEGIGHIALCFVESGTNVLIPDPGYPVYSMSTMIAGGNPCYFPLVAENGFLPDLSEIPESVASKATMMWLNYPNNPTGSSAPLQFFEEAAAFARKHDILICHDAPYTEVYFDGKRTTHLPPDKLFHRGLAHTFQIPKPFPMMTVMENLMLAPKGQAGENLFAPIFMSGRIKRQEKVFQEKALEILHFVTLAKLADHPAGELSGGQMKLLELARVLMGDPQVILLDEPAAGVNPALTRILVEKIQELNARGHTFFIIEHNMDFIMRYCDPIIAMVSGRIVFEGNGADARSDSQLVDAYLGDPAYG